MWRFFDTSALVKRYMQEPGSSWVSAVVDPGAREHIYVCSITEVEVVSAIRRRQCGGTLPASDATAMLKQFRDELAQHLNAIEVTPGLMAHAAFLADTHALRANDAIQLAAAVELSTECLALKIPLVLVSADGELNIAAEAEGLTVDNPADHP